MHPHINCNLAPYPEDAKAIVFLSVRVNGVSAKWLTAVGKVSAINTIDYLIFFCNLAKIFQPNPAQPQGAVTHSFKARNAGGMTPFEAVFCGLIKQRCVQYFDHQRFVIKFVFIEKLLHSDLSLSPEHRQQRQARNLEQDRADMQG